MRPSKSDAWRSGTWGSDMSPAQHTALLSTGFVPVGLVTAISVQKAQHETIDFCARAWSAVASPSSDRRRSGAALSGGFKPTSIPVSPELLDIVATPSIALSMVMRDLQIRCRRLGANGVLGLKVEAKRSIDHRADQYQVTGTAVRSPEGVGWFTAHLSGDEFAKLLRAGWMPVSVIAGTAVGLRHEVIPGKRRLGAAAWRNIEVETWTDVMQRTRAEARTDLSAQLKLQEADADGEVGALLASETTHTTLHSCPQGRGKDRMVRTTLLATAVTEVEPGAAESVGPVLSTIRTGI
jgi:hypothetical protein